MSVTFIYGLIDPITQEVRYVGKANNPYERLYGRFGLKSHSTGHINDKSHTHKAHWIQSLRRQNLIPILCILEQCENIKPVWTVREKDWIAFGKKLGWPLTNEAEGGEGGHGRPRGYHHTEETKRRISEKETGKIESEETIKKKRENSKGEKNSMFGRRHSEKSKELCRIHHAGGVKKGYHQSEKHKENLSISHRGLLKGVPWSNARRLAFEK